MRVFRLSVFALLFSLLIFPIAQVSADEGKVKVESVKLSKQGEIKEVKLTFTEKGFPFEALFSGAGDLVRVSIPLEGGTLVLNRYGELSVENGKDVRYSNGKLIKIGNVNLVYSGGLLYRIYRDGVPSPSVTGVEFGYYRGSRGIYITLLTKVGSVRILYNNGYIYSFGNLGVNVYKGYLQRVGDLSITIIGGRVSCLRYKYESQCFFYRGSSIYDTRGKLTQVKVEII